VSCPIIKLGNSAYELTDLEGVRHQTLLLIQGGWIVEADQQAAEAADVADPIRALTISLGFNNQPLHLFANWPTGNVPRSGVVVATVWNRDGSFIYVGMSGRGFTRGPRATGRLDLQGGSTAMPAGDGVVISSVSMSCGQPRLKQL
jgi:hypothetical protein